MQNNRAPGMPGAADAADGGELARKIYELIAWYHENSTRKEDDYIKANLMLVTHLVGNVESSDDLIFIEKIVDTFCDIIKRQRELIKMLEEAESVPFAPDVSEPSSTPAFATLHEDAESDEKVKAVFCAYMQREGRKPFTINDYILRVQNLWRSFYAAYIADELPDELAEAVISEDVRPNAPLVNAYAYTEELHRYLSMKIAADGTNRNNLNIRAALNMFGKALHGDKYEKIKAVQETPRAKDFSKYIFGGTTYSKCRLVLEVVRRYVEDHHPTTFAELEEAFPSALQGSLGVVRRLEEVPDKYKGIGGVKRYFLNEDEIIHLESGDEIVVCTQFGAANAENFVLYAITKLGYEIKKA